MRVCVCLLGLVNMPRICSKRGVVLLKVFCWFCLEQLVSIGAFDVDH